MRIRYGLLVLVLVTLPIAAEPPQRKAWDWTPEERIALRTDPAAARARVSEMKAAQAVDSFNGKTHPELFLPYQVFEDLVQLGFLSDARTCEVFREGMMPEVTRHGLPADFWERMRLLTTIYVADAHALTDVQQHRVDKYEAMCRSRADALMAARREFGHQRFDRFLYEAIAVNMFSVAFSPPNALALRRAEEGCR